jgi:hypothetical protein
VRRADESTGKLLGDNAARRCFVRGIEKTVEKAYRDAFHARFAQRTDRGAHRFLIERRFDDAIVTQPLRDLAAQRPLDQGRRLVGLKIVELGPFLPADLEQVTKARAGDEPGARAAMLDQRVCRDRRAVTEIRDVASGGADLAQSFLDPPRDRV